MPPLAAVAVSCVNAQSVEALRVEGHAVKAHIAKFEAPDPPLAVRGAAVEARRHEPKHHCELGFRVTILDAKRRCLLGCAVLLRVYSLVLLRDRLPRARPWHCVTGGPWPRRAHVTGGLERRVEPQGECLRGRLSSASAAGAWGLAFRSPARVKLSVPSTVCSSMMCTSRKA